MTCLVAAAGAFALASPTPAYARAPAACLGPDVAARAAFEGGTGAEEGGVMLRNRSGHSCLLSGRAIVDFTVGTANAALPVHVVSGRATDGRTRPRSIVLAAGQRAFVHVRWSNWCGAPYDAVNVRLWLMSVEPRVRVRTTISAPRCEDAASPSRVAVGPYERVP